MKPKRYWRKEKLYAMPHKSGVYFIMDGKTVVYIGQTWCVYCRAMSHKNKDWKWDRVRAIECDKETRKAYEKRLIGIFKPKHNIQHNTGFLIIRDDKFVYLTRDIDSLISSA